MKPQWEKKYPETNNNNKERKLELIKKFTGTNESNIGIKRIDIIERECHKSKVNSNTEIDTKSQKELQLIKSNYKQLEKENSKIKDEVKRLKSINFELQNRLETIDEYKEQIQKLNEQILYYDKQCKETQHKFYQMEFKLSETEKHQLFKIKQLNNTNQQLREVNTDLKQKLSELNSCRIYEDIAFKSAPISSVIEENKSLINRLNSALSEVENYKDKYLRTMAVLDDLNKPKKPKYNFAFEDDDKKHIQHGQLHKEGKWLLFVNSKNEYYIVKNSKLYSGKSGYYVEVKVLDEQYVNIVRVYKPEN